MHLNLGYFILYTPLYRLTARKKHVHVYNWELCEHGLCARALRVHLSIHRGLYIMKNIKCGENKHNRKLPSVFMYTKTRFFFFISMPISVWC